ncbi:uncharacterized protein LOC124809259 [Hydra vulgaris]|uniref:uncharacterized protein LOC124809259 n=1 Tax=Hydra vulgaris TaxID=6087 RepID=UPI001F5EB863|nr:uncharacterized protein LOC124809259 [Hydra vulgaris]
MVNKDLICQLQYRDSAKYPNNYFLIASHAVNIAFTLLFNVALVLGLYFTTRKKKYSRNEKLVIVLSIADITNTLVVSTSQMVLLKRLEYFGCLEISTILFFRVWFLGVTCSIFVMISWERFFTVLYNNKICGITINDAHSIGYFVLVIFFSFLAGICYGFIYASSNMYLQFLLYIGTGCFTLVLLLMIVVANISTLNGIKKKLKHSSLEVQRNAALESRITKTVVITSLAHVLFFCPCIAAQYYMSFIFSKDDIYIIPPALKILIWTLVIRKTSSWINAIIYTLRNRKLSRFYYARINYIFGNRSVKTVPVKFTR